MSCGSYQQHRDSGRPCNTPGSPRSCRLSEQNQIDGLNLNRDRSMTANVQFLQEPWPYLHGCCSGRAVLQVTNAQIRASDQHGRRWTRFTLGIIIVCCIEHLSFQFMPQKRARIEKYGQLRAQRTSARQRRRMPREDQQQKRQHKMLRHHVAPVPDQLPGSGNDIVHPTPYRSTTLRQ